MMNYENQTEKIIDFIACHFGRKFTESDSTKNCFAEVFDESEWNKIDECAKNNATEILKINLQKVKNTYRPI
ncbi:hypothetical protein BLA29_015236, partial [Euroglyphus maynei]